MSDSNITLEKTAELVTIDLGGEISASQVQKLYDHFVTAFESKLPILLNASNLSHIDATSIQTIIAAQNKANNVDIKIRFNETRDEIKELFSLLGLSEHLTEMTKA